jgi:predicted DNA-binding transcriptional regulator AlpA
MSRPVAPSIAPDPALYNPPPRRVLSRDEAAQYVGIGVTKFDELVRDKIMPPSFSIGTRVLWDIRDLDRAVDAIKHGLAANPWDRLG